ncbi:hypothetical protein [Streptomyces sp. NPDC004250]|uniref:hypothetical protein n=1 Tax=Streptomyces sp. NPDC004250 TaxID=3364692 RepID=UPI0036C85E57
MESQSTGVSDKHVPEMKKLYGQVEGFPRQVPDGHLPTYSSGKTPSDQARRRMHSLLNPYYKMSAAEKEVLEKARIPLVARAGGRINIHPDVPRESEGKAVQARVDVAIEIAKLYGQVEGFPRQVPDGHLPTRSSGKTPSDQARRRMHSLLDLKHKVSAAEKEVLEKAGIPLVARAGGRYNIHPDVRLESGRVRVGASQGQALESVQGAVAPARVVMPVLAPSSAGYGHGPAGGTFPGRVQNPAYGADDYAHSSFPLPSGPELVAASAEFARTFPGPLTTPPQPTHPSQTQPYTYPGQARMSHYPPANPTGHMGAAAFNPPTTPHHSTQHTTTPTHSHTTTPHPYHPPTGHNHNTPHTRQTRR